MAGKTFDWQPSSKYLKYINGRSKTGTTKVVTVHTKGGLILGEIKWHAPWRRYCFFPQPNMLFDVSCMKEITSRVEYLMHEYKAIKAGTMPLYKEQDSV